MQARVIITAVLNHYFPKFLKVIYKICILSSQLHNSHCSVWFFHLLPGCLNTFASLSNKIIRFLLAGNCDLVKLLCELNSNEDWTNAIFTHLRILSNDEWKTSSICGLVFGSFSLFWLYFLWGMGSKENSKNYVSCTICSAQGTFCKYTLADMWLIPKPNSGSTANRAQPVLLHTDVQCLHIAYLIALSSIHQMYSF